MPNVAIAKSSRKLRAIDRTRRNVAAIEVYYGGEEPVEIKYKAIPIAFKPGVNEVRDLYGVPKAVAIKARHDKQFGVEFPKTLLIATAVEVASHAEACLRDRGLVILTGDETEDDAQIAQANEAWIKSRAQEARRVIDLYRKRTLAFHQDPRNLGSNPPPMSEREADEQAWLDRYEGGLMITKSYVCPVKCGFQHDDADTMRVHINARHPNADVQDVPELPESAEPAKKRGRPAKIAS